LAIVDLDPAKIGRTGHFLSRKQVIDFAVESRYEPIGVDDSFLRSHMIIILQPIKWLRLCFLGIIVPRGIIFNRSVFSLLSFAP
jgi:hypothetical protein